MHNKTTDGTKLTEPIMVIALMLLFSLIALGLVMLGAKNYGGVTSEMQNNYDMRTSLSYVSTKIRQGDRAKAIALETMKDGSPALVISEEDDFGAYKTWIYFYDGALREFYGDESLEFDISDGTELVKLKAFTIAENSDDLLELTAENANGVSRTVKINARCK